MKVEKDFDRKDLNRADRALAEVDAMSPGLRACVHEFGFAIVNAMRNCGVTDPGRIRQLVYECWRGARQPAQRQAMACQAGTQTLNMLDWMLIQSGSGINAKTLVRVLRQNSLIIVPLHPSPAMIDASLNFTRTVGVVSKREKHTGRLRAAMEAAVKQYWPHLL